MPTAYHPWPNVVIYDNGCQGPSSGLNPGSPFSPQCGEQVSLLFVKRSQQWLSLLYPPQSASRFQRPGVVFKPPTDDLLRIETALFVRQDAMRASDKDFIAIALSSTAALKLNPLEKR